jgi:hypothetical protein
LSPAAAAAAALAHAAGEAPDRTFDFAEYTPAWCV